MKDPLTKTRLDTLVIELPLTRGCSERKRWTGSETEESRSDLDRPQRSRSLI